MSGRVLTIHLVEGTANGLQTAQIDGWIGKVFVAPKTDLLNLLQQPELNSQGLGVYVLIGDDPDNFNKNVIYVGEGQVRIRLTDHLNNGDKDYWDNRTLVILTENSSLSKDGCTYLESRLIDLARKSGTCTVKNIQNPPLPYLIATEKTKIENFLSEIQVLLPVLNINFFVPPIKIPPKLQTLSPQPLLLTLTTTTVSAEAEIIDNKFVVRQGAMASASEVTSLGASYVALRRQLKDDGKLVNSSEHDKYTFSQDVEFNSLTAAAAVICGSTMSGPATWKVKDTGQTYSAWLQEQVDAASAVPDGVVIATDTAVVQ